MGSYNTDTIILYFAGFAVFTVLIIIIVLAANGNNENGNNENGNNENGNNENGNNINNAKENINEKTRDIGNDSVTFSDSFDINDNLASVEDYTTEW